MLRVDRQLRWSTPLLLALLAACSNASSDSDADSEVFDEDVLASWALDALDRDAATGLGHTDVAASHQDLPTPVDYLMSPPSPCHNQFWVPGCEEGNEDSPCEGVCTVANACSPPEEPDKARFPMTFLCPRFMLFSREMLQAARDDTNRYGWGNPSDPPFHYGVVGHDADLVEGGIDDHPSTCCQCYQLVFELPESTSPQPPQLPLPKPLIVQSFNTEAGSPSNFDIFMGAGGYGAYNACFDDPTYPFTSDFGVFMYDTFPWENPMSGGISFLRYPECMDGTRATPASVKSSACQNRIEGRCRWTERQDPPASMARVVEDTTQSCIRTNRFESLYHQNWSVRVRKVICPVGLTRVTGCRLHEDAVWPAPGHPRLPAPQVRTPEQAELAGNFSDPGQYATTTMQDCCKPSCSWTHWVQGHGLTPDGPWESFYSCDRDGLPLVR